MADDRRSSQRAAFWRISSVPASGRAARPRHERIPPYAPCRRRYRAKTQKLMSDHGLEAGPSRSLPATRPQALVRGCLAPLAPRRCDELGLAPVIPRRARRHRCRRRIAGARPVVQLTGAARLPRPRADPAMPGCWSAWIPASPWAPPSYPHGGDLVHPAIFDTCRPTAGWSLGLECSPCRRRPTCNGAFLPAGHLAATGHRRGRAVTRAGTAHEVLHVESGRHLYGGARRVSTSWRVWRGSAWDNLLACPGRPIAEPARAHARVFERAMKGDADIWPGLAPPAPDPQQRPDRAPAQPSRRRPVGRRRCPLAGVPCVLSRRVDNPESRWLVAAKCRLYDHVITISEGIREYCWRKAWRRTR